MTCIRANSGRFKLLERRAATDPQARRLLVETLRPYLDRVHGAAHNMVNDFLIPLRAEEFQAQKAVLESPASTPEERAAAITSAIALVRVDPFLDSRQEGLGLIDQIRRLPAQEWSAPLWRRHPREPLKALGIYAAVSPGGISHWQAFEALNQQLDGDEDEALEHFPRLARELAKGANLKVALSQTMRGWLRGDPVENVTPSIEIEVSADWLTIGDHGLPVD